MNLAGELQECTPGASAQRDLEGELRRLLDQPWEDGDPAFLAGLVHDVGRVALYSLAADMRRHSRGANEISYSGLTQVSDLLHARLGAVITDAWGISSTISVAIAHHHEPDAAPDPARPFADGTRLRACLGLPRYRRAEPAWLHVGRLLSRPPLCPARW